MTESNGGVTPRVLSINIELHVPTGLRRNIHMRRVEQAVDKLTRALTKLAPRVFPWAKTLRVDWAYGYVYRPFTGTDEEIDLPANQFNSPIGPDIDIDDVDIDALVGATG